MFGAMSCYENFMVASTYDASSKVKIVAPVLDFCLLFHVLC